jgi:hypothetical protein
MTKSCRVIELMRKYIKVHEFGGSSPTDKESTKTYHSSWRRLERQVGDKTTVVKHVVLQFVASGVDFVE